MRADGRGSVVFINGYAASPQSPHALSAVASASPLSMSMSPAYVPAMGLGISAGLTTNSAVYCTSVHTNEVLSAAHRLSPAAARRPPLPPAFSSPAGPAHTLHTQQKQQQGVGLVDTYSYGLVNGYNGHHFEAAPQQQQYAAVSSGTGTLRRPDVPPHASASYQTQASALSTLKRSRGTPAPSNGLDADHSHSTPAGGKSDAALAMEMLALSSSNATTPRHLPRFEELAHLGTGSGSRGAPGAAEEYAMALSGPGVRESAALSDGLPDPSVALSQWPGAASNATTSSTANSTGQDSRRPQHEVCV